MGDAKAGARERAHVNQAKLRLSCDCEARVGARALGATKVDQSKWRRKSNQIKSNRGDWTRALVGAHLASKKLDTKSNHN